MSIVFIHFGYMTILYTLGGVLYWWHALVITQENAHINNWKTFEMIGGDWHIQCVQIRQIVWGWSFQSLNDFSWVNYKIYELVGCLMDWLTAPCTQCQSTHLFTDDVITSLIHGWGNTFQVFTLTLEIKSLIYFYEIDVYATWM